LTDHLNPQTIKKISYLRPNLKFVVGKYMAQTLYDLKIEPRNIVAIDFDKVYDFNAFKCLLSEIPHDVSNVAVHLEIDNEKLLYATYTSRIEHLNAKHYDYYLIEGNYKEKELEERKERKLLNGEYVIEDRVANSHLSYEQCLDFFMNNARDTSILEVMHQHIEKD
jgi:hypothetical protein